MASDHYDYYCECGHYWSDGCSTFRQYGNPKHYLTKSNHRCPSCGSSNTVLFNHTSDRLNMTTECKLI